MTIDEKQKAIDALKISVPVMAMTPEEFNDYIQTLNKIMDWLEQEENSEIRNEVKDLSERVENIEKQMKEDKEEQLKKLKAELDYAKFRCALPTIMDNMMARDKK